MSADRIDLLTTIAEERQRQQVAEQYAQEEQEEAVQSAEVLRQQAAQTTHSLGAQADEMNDRLRDLAEEAKQVITAARSGAITKDEAVARLREARKVYTDLAGQRKRLEADLAATRAVLDDPEQERARLLSKYPALRR